MVSGRRQDLEARRVTVSARDDHGIDKGRIVGRLTAVDDDQGRAFDMMLHGIVDVFFQSGCRLIRIDTGLQALPLRIVLRCGFPDEADAELRLIFKQEASHLIPFGGASQTDQHLGGKAGDMAVIGALDIGVTFGVEGEMASLFAPTVGGGLLTDFRERLFEMFAVGAANIDPVDEMDRGECRSVDEPIAVYGAVDELGGTIQGACITDQLLCLRW